MRCVSVLDTNGILQSSHLKPPENMRVRAAASEFLRRMKENDDFTYYEYSVVSPSGRRRIEPEAYARTLAEMEGWTLERRRITKYPWEDA